MSVLSKKVTTMQAKLNQLRETEENLDHLCKAMRENYKQARKSATNEFFAYVTRDDLLDVYGKDSVILTIRNCDTIREGKTKEEDDTTKHTLKVHGRWKSVDVRLVTTDGQVACQSPITSENMDVDGETNETQQNVSASQPESKNNAATNSRRPGRRRKPDKVELIKDEDGGEIDQPMPTTSFTEEEKELEERRITAETLLGYRPPIKQRKRKWEDDWLESRYKITHILFLHSKTKFWTFFSLHFVATQNPDHVHPLVRLSPPRSKYNFTLRRTEGVCDLFMGGSITR